MQIKDYLNDILNTISVSPYIKCQNFSFEERPPNAAYIKGLITFVNCSKLYFKEFVIFKSESVTLLKYGYNYLDKDEVLVFRYDNALDPQAKKLLTYPAHKHTPEKLLAASRPTFKEILREIANLIEQNVKK